MVGFLGLKWVCFIKPWEKKFKLNNSFWLGDVCPHVQTVALMSKHVKEGMISLQLNYLDRVFLNACKLS